MSNIEVTNILKKLWGYLRVEKVRFALVMFGILLSTVISVICPWLMQEAIDHFLILGKLKELFSILLVLLCLYVGKSILTFIINYTMSFISEKTLYRIRNDLFTKVETLDLIFFDQHSSGDLMSIFTNDITLMNDALTETIIEIVNSIFILFGVAIMMFTLNTVLSFTVIATVPLFFFFLFKIGKRANESFLKQQDSLGKLSSKTEEFLTGMKGIHAANQEENSFYEFQKLNQKYRDISICSQLYAGLVLPVNALITNLGNVILILVSSILILKGNVTIGMILAFLNYASMFRSPINNLASLFTSLGSALAGAKRIFTVLEEEPKMIDNIQQNAISKMNGHIAFDAVSFAYGNHQVFKQLSFSIKPGMMIAIVGPTGSGKTTIANILMRFYPIQNGQIFINHQNIEDFKISDIRKKIGIVLQEPYLFSVSVKDNISYGNENATLDEIVMASKQIGAHDFIHRLPNGYDTILEENGSSLSEGEKQLIALTRVMLSDPDLLILDEATSHVDAKTERVIQSGLKTLRKGKTSFVIAHRLSTIQEADLILVLNHGKIIESGTHQSLLSQNGFYHKLYMSQFEN